MKIVGVDASLTSTGICVLNNTKTETRVVASKLIGVKRLIEIRNEIMKLCTGSDLVVIESYSYGSTQKSHQIGELGGILRVMFHELGQKYIEVAPTAVKKFATGKGNANKEKVAVGVYKHWGQEFETNDEADAAVLAYIGRAYLGEGEGLTAYQAEVIATIKGV